MREFLAITKALSDEMRVRALLALRQGELCLCQIIELLGLSPATVSRHMDVLVRAGLVERRKEGRWCYFRPAGRRASRAARRTLDWVFDCLRSHPAVEEDVRRIARIRRVDLEDLCECYRS